MDLLTESVFGKVAKMREAHRYYGQFCFSKESNAEHSYQVAVIAGAIARTMKERCRKGHAKYNEVEALDLSDVYEEALYHDIDEMFALDLPGPFKLKYPHMAQVYQSALDAEVETYCSKQKDGRIRAMYTKHSRSEGTLTHQLVHIADKVQVLSYMLAEASMGNSRMRIKFEKNLQLVNHLISLLNMPEVFGQFIDYADNILKCLPKCEVGEKTL